MLAPLNKLDPRSSCGGKARALGALLSAGVNVPEGFVLLAEAFSDHARRTGQAREKFLSAPLAREILMSLEAELDGSPGPWAVRSSASDEDGAERAWAGVFQSFLNVQHADVPARIKDCWASVFTEQAGSYADANGIGIDSLGMAVIVQRLVLARVSGVAFSVSPLSGAADRILIESSFGLGEAVVSGAVTPDRYSVERSNLEVSDRAIGVKSKALIPNKDGSASWKYLLRLEGKQPSLTDAEAKEIASAALAIERSFKCPVDIEWAYEGETLYILQARPITR